MKNVYAYLYNCGMTLCNWALLTLIVCGIKFLCNEKFENYNQLLHYGIYAMGTFLFCVILMGFQLIKLNKNA